MAYLSAAPRRASPADRRYDLGFFAALRLWAEAARERRALRSLGYSRLEDIGVDPKAADREASRPFWSVRKRR